MPLGTRLDDDSGWTIEANLRASGPVLRDRVRSPPAPDGRTQTGVLVQVSDAALFRRFEARSKALLDIEHPGIAKPIRHGRHRGRPYRIEPLQPHARLANHIGELSARQSVRFVREVAEAVAVLHRRRLIHGYLSPDNILVQTAPDGVRPLLFEIPAVDVGPWQAHAAPEILQGQNADARTDVFGLGMLLWALLTGRAPGTASRTAWMESRPGPAVKLPTELGLPPHQRDLLLRMIDRSPRARPQDVSDVITILGGGRSMPRPVPRRDASASPTASDTRAPGALLAGGLACAAVAAVATFGIMRGLQPPASSPDVTQTTAALSAADDAVTQTETVPAAAHSRTEPTEPEDTGSSALAYVERPDVVRDAKPSTADSPPTAGTGRATLRPVVPSDRTARRPPPRTPTSSAPPPQRSVPTHAHAPSQPVEAVTAPQAAERTSTGATPEAVTALRPEVVEGIETVEAVEVPPTNPETPPHDPAVLDGRWRGVVNGRSAEVDLVLNEDGTLAGSARVRVGPRTEIYPVVGRYKLGANTSASVSLALRGTRTAWSGRLTDGQLQGNVLVNQRVRGEFSFVR